VAADWIDVRDGGRLLYVPGFRSPRAADALFAWLRAAVPWRQEVAGGLPLPRLNAWFADDGLRFFYAGAGRLGSGWPPQLAAVVRAVEGASGARFNSLLLNLYRDGRDFIPPHSDARPELGEDPVVATVSLGAERALVLRHAGGGESLTYRPAHGSLLVMGGAFQRHWLHEVPRDEEGPVGEQRISLTFRLITRNYSGHAADQRG
jgi:alkylated DNA repair dioxygenase AlkB